MITECDGQIHISRPEGKLTDADKVEFLLDILCAGYAAPGVDARKAFMDSMEGGVTHEEFCDIYILSRNQEPIVFDDIWSVKELRAVAEKNARVLRNQFKRSVQLSVFCTAVCAAVVAIINLISKG